MYFLWCFAFCLHILWSILHIHFHASVICYWVATPKYNELKLLWFVIFHEAMGWLGGSCAPHGIYYSGGCIQLGTSVLHELSHSPRHLHVFVLQLASQECFPKAWQLRSKRECSRDRPKVQALLKAVLHEWYYAPLKSHCQSQTHGQGQSWYGGTTKGHEFRGHASWRAQPTIVVGHNATIYHNSLIIPEY